MQGYPESSAFLTSSLTALQNNSYNLTTSYTFHCLQFFYQSSTIPTTFQEPTFGFTSTIHNCMVLVRKSQYTTNQLVTGKIKNSTREKRYTCAQCYESTKL
uniref:Uncharacterized protein n=1 Tax=Opuntia streptacantha TaxID=393608 RepID=A0A7C9DTU0_OPUST